MIRKFVGGFTNEEIKDMKEGKLYKCEGDPCYKIGNTIYGIERYFPVHCWNYRHPWTFLQAARHLRKLLKGVNL